jgi:hypothetical protein
MTSPLAALCRLGGLLSPPSASAAVTAAKRPNSCCTAPSGDRTCDLGSGRTQRNVMGAGAGAAGLLVGLAGCEAGIALEGAAYMRHAGPCGANSPPRACRSAKGVCMKVSAHAGILSPAVGQCGKKGVLGWHVVWGVHAVASMLVACTGHNVLIVTVQPVCMHSSGAVLEQ